MSDVDMDMDLVDDQESSGQQRARFSLYAPFVAYLIGQVAKVSNDQTVAIIAVVINLGLIVTGFCLALAALAAYSQHHRSGVLGRAIGGVLFNGLALAGAAYVLVPLAGHLQTKHKLAGRWSMNVPPGYVIKSATLTLTPDGDFTLESSTARGPTALAGHWGLNREEVLGVKVDRVSTGANPATIGKPIGLGKVQSVDDYQMTLTTDHGEETYARIE